MGCDIHCFLERKKVGAERFEIVPAPLRIRDEGRSLRDWYSHRNYNSFAILADVRNGIGFAGCYTGEPFEPLPKVRKGVPEDASAGYLEEVERWGGHSHAYVSVPELLAGLEAMEAKTRRGGGVVQWKTWVEWHLAGREGKFPSNAAWVSGRGVFFARDPLALTESFREAFCRGKGVVDPEPFVDRDATTLIDNPPIGADCLYVFGENFESYREAAPDLWDFADELRSLDSIDELRLVFFFDN